PFSAAVVAVSNVVLCLLNNMHGAFLSATSTMIASCWRGWQWSVVGWNYRNIGATNRAEKSMTTQAGVPKPIHHEMSVTQKIIAVIFFAGDGLPLASRSQRGEFLEQVAEFTAFKILNPFFILKRLAHKVGGAEIAQFVNINHLCFLGLVLGQAKRFRLVSRPA
ncbi:MAG: hypothetical protein ACRCVX_03200, partial [Shewanella sp.]